MTDVAKLVVRAARGQLPSHAYFEGCSTGGQQALSEAQRYPGDYDGIVAGDPGHNRVRLILGFLWSWIATHDSEQGWGTYLVNPREPARIGFFRYLAFHDPRWDWRTFDCDRDVAFADAQVPELSATSHDLRAFQARGGKLVMDTGWADPVVPPQDTVAYYDEVVKASGGLARTQSFFRFFPVPGIAHCGGGVGTSTFDALGTLDAWIERGTAPQQLLGQRIVNGAVERTRPICAYPKVAHYRETGSTDVAESFVCADPASAAATSTPRASASPNSR
jgi:feruloyl esterase